VGVGVGVGVVGVGVGVGVGVAMRAAEMLLVCVGVEGGVGVRVGVALLLEGEREGGWRVSPIDIRRVWALAAACDLGPPATIFTAAATATKMRFEGEGEVGSRRERWHVIFDGGSNDDDDVLRVSVKVSGSGSGP